MNLVNEEAMTHWGLLRQLNKNNWWLYKLIIIISLFIYFLF